VGKEKEEVEAEGFELMTSERLGLIPHMDGFWGKRKLIALAGPAYCGKDTVAGILRREFPVCSLAFADPIRTMLRDAFGLTNEHFFGKLKEVPLDWLGKSPRQLMQTLGTEWGRGLIHEDLWLIMAERKVSEIHSSGFHAVITDCRFENEAARVRALGGVVWHIKRGESRPVNAHVSEMGIQFQPGDKEIDNNGTIQDLVDEVSVNF
jgi:hypothetical protein